MEAKRFNAVPDSAIEDAARSSNIKVEDLKKAVAAEMTARIAEILVAEALEPTGAKGSGFAFS